MANRVIHKFRLPSDSRSRVRIPKGATILHLDVQNDWPQIWAEVDPAAPKVLRAFNTAATGTSVPTGEYLGSFQLRGGFVGHVYVEPETP